MLSIGCYGRTGPYADFVNYGPQVNGQAGLLAVSGYEGEGVLEGPCAYGDPATGVFAAFLINAALTQRRRTGLGQYFEVSMMEVLAMSAARGVAGICDERARLRPARQSRYVDGAAQLLQGVGRSRGLGRDRGGHG